MNKIKIKINQPTFVEQALDKILEKTNRKK
jgi:hypothetical protein